MIHSCVSLFSDSCSWVPCLSWTVKLSAVLQKNPSAPTNYFCVFELLLGDMAQKIITIIFFTSVNIDNYHDKFQIFISFKFKARFWPSLKLIIVEYSTFCRFCIVYVNVDFFCSYWLCVYIYISPSFSLVLSFPLLWIWAVRPSLPSSH